MELHKKNSLKITMLLVTLLSTIFISFFLGRLKINFFDFIDYYFNKNSIITSIEIEKYISVIQNVRLPRILCAVFVGASLSISGSVYQGIFKNPMASPSILGASSGAAFGAALGIVLSRSIWEIQFFSFFFGLIAVVLAYVISLKFQSGSNNIILILSGMLISTLFSSFLSLIKFTADPYSKLPDITFWLLGSLTSVNLSDLKMVLLIFIIAFVPLYLYRWDLNILSFNDIEAIALGLNIRKIKTIAVITSTLLTASVISISGLIGWVGLVIPHLTRIIVGPDFKYLLPSSALLGGLYLLIVDDFTRLVYTMEIPIGILTSIIGAPFFIYIMLKSHKGWN